MYRFGASFIAVWVGSFALLSGPAFAEKRVALVIGNSAYENVARLANPANDAASITTTLKEAGFDVVDSRRNLKIADMRRAFRDFADKSRDADVAVVYYAGHGIEVDGTNYLVPVDAALERDLDIYDEAFPLERILVTIEPAKQLRLVMLDACRDNPFAKTMKRTIGSRAIGRGLAKVEPTSPNTLIAFASKAGSTASDGDSKNSPFTSALVKHIATPGLDLRKAFGYVRDDVLKNTSNKQEPYVYGSLGGDDVPLVAAKPIPPTQPQGNPMAEVRRDYELALQLGTKEVWMSFLAQFPNGFYTDMAKAQLSKITAEEARIAATEKARAAAEEKERLAAEGARKAEQAKAAAQARAAEEARIASEKAKEIEQTKAAAAEERRVTAERAAAEKAAAKVEADRKLAENAAKDAATRNSPVSQPEQKVAALAPTSEATAPPLALTLNEINRSVQIELRRVGCFNGSVDGEWSASSRRAVELFNSRAGFKLDVKLASLDTLDALKSKPSRVCPLICGRGFRADGERCARISCAAGSFLNEDNECERKREKPRRQEARQKPKPAAETAPSSHPTRHCVAGLNNQGNVMGGRPSCL